MSTSKHEIASLNNTEVTPAPNTTLQPDAMLTMIDKVCTSPDFDILKMEKLIDMRNSEIERISEIDFNRDFAEMQSQLPRVITTHENSQTKSKYAKIEDINNAVLPILNKYGFSVSFKVLSQDKKGVKVRAILAHSQGHKEFTDLFMPYDNKGAQGKVNKTDIHATGSTITYAKRYALCMLLDISTGTDNDGNNSKFITPEQVTKINDLLEETSIDKIKFIEEYMRVKSIPEIPIKNYRKAVNALQTRQINTLKAEIKKNKDAGESI